MRVIVCPCVAGMRFGAFAFPVSCARAPHRSRHVHAPLRKVASPDGAVGREWCYVEVKPLGRAVVVVANARVPSLRACAQAHCVCVRDSNSFVIARVFAR